MTPTFKSDWENLFFFTKTEEVAKCLICNRTLNQLKKFNLKRHYTIYHSKEYDEYVGEQRTTLINQLKEKMMSEEVSTLIQLFCCNHFIN